MRAKLPSPLSGGPAAQGVSREELDARLGGQDLEQPPALRLEQPRREDEAAGGAPVEDEVVIVPAGGSQLVVGRADPRADARGAPEIERGAGHGAELAGRNERWVHRNELRREDGELVAEHVPGA